MEKSKKAVEYTIKATRQDFDQKTITKPEDAQSYARKFYKDDIMVYESVFIMLLDRSNKVIGYAKISQGGVCSTVVDVKIVAKYAVDALASSVILVHNHPSGNCTPSENDKMLAKRMKKALEYLDVAFLDSIIITEDGYYSLSDNIF